MSDTLITRDDTLPVSLTTVKNHLPMAPAYQGRDSQLSDYIWSATDLLEKQYGLTLVEAQWSLTLDRWAYPIILPKYPVKTIDEITYYNGSNELTTLHQTDEEEEVTGNIIYRTPSNGKGRIWPSTGLWPTSAWRPNAITVTYTAGWVILPKAAELAISTIVKSLFDGTTTDNTILDRLILCIDRGGNF